MAGLFSEDTALTSLDLSSWNTSNVTSMAGLFSEDTALTSLDLSSWNTSNVTEFDTMFMNCSSLETLNISSFSFENATYDMIFEGINESCEIIVNSDAYSILSESYPNLNFTIV